MHTYARRRLSAIILSTCFPFLVSKLSHFGFLFKRERRWQVRALSPAASKQGSVSESWEWTAWLASNCCDATRASCQPTRPCRQCCGSGRLLTGSDLKVWFLNKTYIYFHKLIFISFSNFLLRICFIKILFCFIHNFRISCFFFRMCFKKCK